MARLEFHHAPGRIRPFGYPGVGADGALEEDEDERKALRTMRAMRAEGDRLRAIAAAMEARGVRVSHQGMKQARRPLP